MVLAYEALKVLMHEALKVLVYEGLRYLRRRSWPRWRRCGQRGLEILGEVPALEACPRDPAGPVRATQRLGIEV
jgi:hypothetical protein